MESCLWSTTNIFFYKRSGLFNSVETVIGLLMFSLLSCSTASHLQVPDVYILFGNSLHGVSHQSDEHVEQQDVSQDNVGDEQDVENFLILNMVSKLQIPHSNREFEQLQYCEPQVVVSWLFAQKCLNVKAPSSRQ